MTKITNSKVLILLIAVTSVGILGSISFSGTVIAQDMQGKAIPEWVDNNFKWYGEGKIGQSDLLNSLTYMLDNSIMHLSDKAAQEMQSLRAENAELRSKAENYWVDITMPDGSSSDNASPGSQLAPSQTKVLIAASQNDDSVSDYCATTATHAYTDENGNDFLMVPVPAQGSSDDKSSCWVRVSQTHAGDPDRPIITGQVPNPESDDRPTEEVAFYYNKISAAYDTVDDIMAKGGTTSAWKDGIDKLSSNHGDSTVDSVVDDLQGVVVLCSTAIDKEILKIEAELAVLEELHDRLSEDSTQRSGSTTQYGESDMEFIQRHAQSIDEKILSLQTGLKVLEEELATADSFSFSVEREMKESGEKGGTEDLNIGIGELQETVQQQQQTLQTMSNVSKSLQETQMAAISIG